MAEEETIPSLTNALETPLFQTIRSIWPQFSSNLSSIRFSNETILMLVLWCLDGLKEEDNEYHLQNMWYNINNHLKDIAFERKNGSINDEECKNLTNIILAFAIDCLEWSCTIEFSGFYNRYYSPVRRDPAIKEHFDEIKKYIDILKNDTLKKHRSAELKKWLMDYLDNDVFYTTEEFEWNDSEEDSNALDNIQSESNENSSLVNSIDNLSNSLNQLSTQNTIVHKHPQMPSYITRENAIEIYNFLIDGKYIAPETSSEDFLYLMGVTTNASNKIKPINWQNTVQQLRRFVELAYCGPIQRKAIKLVDIERKVPLCFLNKGKQMTALAKSTTENTHEIDRLEEFFRPK